MSSLIPRATDLAHLLLALAISPGDTVIDATAGQGRDTCFLAALVGQDGQVWAFDIQREACDATITALQQQGLAAQTRVIHDSHARLGGYDIAPAAAAVFNLGWLPGGNHDITTERDSTVAALTAALAKLKPGGALVVTAYPGHAAGAEEYRAVLDWLKTLPSEQAQSLQIDSPAKQQAPVVIFIQKVG